MTSGGAGHWSGVGSSASSFGQPQFDSELGLIFIRMRNLLGISLWDMARRVGGDPTVIADLEAGALNALPPWPELTRLVDAYAAATGIDPQPIIARLLRTQAVSTPRTDQLSLTSPRTITVEPQNLARGPRNENSASGAADADADLWAAVGTPTAHADRRDPTQVSAVPTGARRRMPAAPAAASKVSRARAFAVPAEVMAATGGMKVRATRSAVTAWRGMQRLLRRRLAGVLLLAGLPLLILATARLAPALLYTVLSPLPSVVAAPLAMGVGQLVSVMAPERDGLTWIDIGDPRLRKADRLPERGR